MADNDISALGDLKVSIDDPLFYQRVFTLISKLRRRERAHDQSKLEKICFEEFDDISRRLDLTDIQASTSVRNVLKTRRIATLLFTNEGKLNVNILPSLIDCFRKALYSLGPSRQFDTPRQEHILKALIILRDNKEIQRFFKNVGKPYFNQYADQVIRETLCLPINSIITDAYAKRAILSAWLCYLRQNVGSCFATAPSIIIHDEQPEQMLEDMAEILHTGRLRRTFGGTEYSVPISASWGTGDLKVPFILSLSSSTVSGIGASPGLIQAFQAAGLINCNGSMVRRIEQSEALILDILKTWEVASPYVTTSAEEIVRRVLLKQLGLTQRDLDNYENRSHGIQQIDLIEEKSRVFSDFYLRFDAAKNAFKGLGDNALLKIWEFTIASFAETKARFTRWNLYSSLGFEPQEEGGIGQAIYVMLQQKINEANRKMEEFQEEYKTAYQNIKFLEGRIKIASSEREAHWISAEYQSKRNEFNALEEMRNHYHHRARRFAHLFDIFVDIYDELFPCYFQEVYDADMHEVTTGPYDDSPAGFRLVYKHGRSDTSQWTRIETPNDFVEALVSFFRHTESEVAASPELAGLESDVYDIVSAIIMQIRSPVFLETAFHRMARSHHAPIIEDPLRYLDQIAKKPWAYTSGGAMATLVSCYFKNETRPTMASESVESPTDLLIFLIDTAREVASKFMKGFKENPNKSLLMYSPTHAFLLKPGLGLFHEAIQDNTFTYTYVRDRFIRPMERFLNNLDLEESMQEYLIKKIAQKFSPDVRRSFRLVLPHITGKKNPIEFRGLLAEILSQGHALRCDDGIINMNQIDSLLYSALPLFPACEVKTRSCKILAMLPGLSPDVLERISRLWKMVTPSVTGEVWMDAKSLQDITKAMICLALKETSSSYDYHWHVSQAARELGYTMPMPVIFADTNWIQDLFAFLVNPGTGKFELWRVDYTGSVGAPMVSWERWLDGSERSQQWGIYIRPDEYGPERKLSAC